MPRRFPDYRGCARRQQNARTWCGRSTVVKNAVANGLTYFAPPPPPPVAELALVEGWVVGWLAARSDGEFPLAGPFGVVAAIVPPLVDPGFSLCELDPIEFVVVPEGLAL
jgi:hypothetical protein